MPGERAEDTRELRRGLAKIGSESVRPSLEALVAFGLCGFESRPRHPSHPPSSLMGRRAGGIDRPRGAAGDGSLAWSKVGTTEH